MIQGAVLPSRSRIVVPVVKRTAGSASISTPRLKTLGSVSAGARPQARLWEPLRYRPREWAGCRTSLTIVLPRCRCGVLGWSPRLSYLGQITQLHQPHFPHWWNEDSNSSFRVLVRIKRAQRVKTPPEMQETSVWSLGQQEPPEKGMAIHASIHGWRIPGTEEPGRLESVGS